VLIVTPPAAPAAPPPPPPVVAAPAPAFEQVPATSANLPTYRPEPYDPKTAGAVLPATDILQLYGVVLPKRRNRAARFLLALLVVALAGSGFYAWRQLQHTKHSGGPITVTSAAGKFMARFPHAPITQVRTWHYDHDIRAVLHVAADSDDHALVMGARLTPSPSNRAITAALPTVGRGLAGDGTLIPADQHRIVFQGHSALEGELWAPDGTTVSFLVVNYGGGQLYFLLAPAGPTFTDLTASFVALR
jgi:hypothetical protein